MIDVSEFIWKLEMLKIWISVEVDFCTVFHDTMNIFNETGVLVHLKASQGSFEDFLHYASFNYITKDEVC